MYSIKEQDLLFPWQTFIAFLMILSAMQFTMLRPQDVQASVYKEKAEQIKPIEVTPVAPVKPKFLQIVKTEDDVRYSKQDLFCMAKNIYHEAGSEPTLGKYAVAQVTINRMKSPQYKNYRFKTVMSNIKLTKAEAEKKVYQLTEDLLHVKKDFKDVAAGYKDRMKEIESEIKAIVEEASIGDPTK